MPTFQADLPDGRTIDFDAEKEPTNEDIAAAVAKFDKDQPVDKAPEGTPELSAAPKMSPAKAFFLGLGTGIAPSTGFVAGAIPGGIVGTATGGPVGGFAGSLATGLLGSSVVNEAQQRALQSISPDLAKRLEMNVTQAQREHPWWFGAGGVAAMSPSAKFAPFKLATIPFRATVGAGIPAAQSIIHGEKPSAESLAMGAAGSILYGEPRIPGRIAALLPRAAAEASKQPAAEPAAQPEVADASEEQKTAEVHVNVRPQPGEVPGEVPAQGSGEGVQPQATQVDQEAQLPVEPAKAPEASTEAPKVDPVSDRVRYDELQQRLKEIWRSGRGMTDPENVLLSKEMEAIKNRNPVKKGMPPPNLSPLDLQPALKVGDQIITGGESHEAVTKSGINAALPGEPQLNIIEAAAEDSNHVFQHKNGNVLTREQAGKALGEKERLTSARLKELQEKARSATSKPPIIPPKPPQDEPGLEMISMGGARPYEFQRGSTTPSSIKNATVDQERTARGLPPAMAPVRRTLGQVWDRAMALIDRDPEAQDRLFAELRAKSRALTDEEDALLLHRQIDLQNEYGKATRDLAQAYDDGRTDFVAHEKQRVEDLSDKLTDLYDIGKKSGTETARGLAARRAMVNEDFTLAQMEVSARAAKGGAPLTDQERAGITALQAKIEATQKAYDDYVATSKQRESELEAARLLAESKAQAAAPPQIDKRVLDYAEGIVKKLESAGSAALARIKARRAQGRLFAGIPPEDLADYAIWGSSRIARAGLDLARFTDEAVREFGEAIKPHVQQIWEDANNHLLGKIKDSPEEVQRVIRKAPPKEQIEAATGKIKAKVAAGARDDIYSSVQKIVRAMVQENPNIQLPQLWDQVHAVLSSVIPNITKPETLDAISGRGRFTVPSQDQIEKQKRDLKQQGRLVGHQLDVIAGRPLPRTGPQRDVMSDAARREQQTLNELMRKHGVVRGDPQATLRTMLQSRKTALQHEIADLEQEIDTRQRIVKTKTPVPTDPETEALKARRDQLKAEHESVFPKAPITEEELLKRSGAALDRQIAELERQIKEREVFPGSKEAGPTSRELEAKRARIEALKSEREYVRESLNPKTRTSPEERALKALKSRLQHEIADRLERSANKDFAPRVAKPITLDAEAERLQAENERSKEQFRQQLSDWRDAQKPRWQRILDSFVRWERALKLSSPVVFGKLGAAAITRGVTTATEEAVGGLLGKLPGVSTVAAGAPREGGFSGGAMARALWSALTAGVRDARQTFRTGQSDLDILAGHQRHDTDFSGLFGRTHGSIKAPVKRGEYELSLAKRLAWHERQGTEMSEAQEQKVKGEAVNDALRSVFMNHSFAPDMFNNFVSFLERSKTYQPEGYVSARLLRFLLPIVRVPANIVSEVATGAFGFPAASFRVLAHTLNHSLAELPPEVKDDIMRQLKKGSIGAVLMAIGFANPENVGGFDWREKRKKGSVKTAGFQIFGVDIPRWMTHAPWFELMQIGATIRHVMNQHLPHSGEHKGFGEGLWAAGTGMLEQVPFYEEMARVMHGLGSESGRERFIGELARSTLVPQLVQKIAEWNDSGTKRKPKSIWQHIEYGIPGLRQNVPRDKSLTR